VVRTKSGEVDMDSENFSIHSIAMSHRRAGSSLILAVLFFAFLCPPSAHMVSGQSMEAENTTAAAPNTGAHPILVELFTSEGCSTCPPADALLEKMDAVQPIAGAQLIVLSEHVDYWDHDGWKDPNSSAALTERQRAYVSALGLKTAYTPQLIVDGSNEIRVSDPQQMETTLRSAAAAATVPVSIGAVTTEPGNPTILRTHIEADGVSDKHNADIYVAVALDHVESQVLHGENGGRHLTHVAVVQQLIKVGRLSKGKGFAEDVQLKLKPGTDPKTLRLIAFVQEPGPGRVLGAALRKPAI
jgi:hypothetical protein